jgi:hypothetical protein
MAVAWPQPMKISLTSSHGDRRAVSNRADLAGVLGASPPPHPSVSTPDQLADGRRGDLSHRHRLEGLVLTPAAAISGPTYIGRFGGRQSPASELLCCRTSGETLQ